MNLSIIRTFGIKGAIVVLATFFLIGCYEDISGNSSKEDQSIIEKYVDSYGWEGAFTTEGIFKNTISAGTGSDSPLERQGVILNYRLSLANKTVIIQDENILLQQGLHFFFEGFDLALSGMVKGEKAQFFIPSNLAYKSKSFYVNGNTVPSKAVLILELELLDIVEEEEIIASYQKLKNVEFSPTKSGLFYRIKNRGASAISPEVNDIVSIEYNLSNTTDTLYTEKESISFTIQNQKDWGDSDFPDGLEEGILLMKEGDEATFILPSPLAFGSEGTSTIPGHAILIYDVKLTKVLK